MLDGAHILGRMTHVMGITKAKDRTSLHDRRLAERLKDPRFKAAFLRAEREIAEADRRARRNAPTRPAEDEVLGLLTMR